MTAIGAASSAAAPAVVEYPVFTIFDGGIVAAAWGPEENLWFVQATERDDRGTVERIAPNGEFTGSQEWNGSMPTDITQGPDGNMWVTKRGVGAGVIARITPAYGFTEFPLESGAESPFLGPLAIATGPDDNLWFTDTLPHQNGKIYVGRITTAGVITEFPVPTGSGTSVPEAADPAGIAAGPDGNVWFTDKGKTKDGHNLIGKITPAGVIAEYPVPTPGAEPTAIANGSDGNLWFTEPGISRIGRITPMGMIKEYAAPVMGGELNNLVLGPDGNMWFSGGFGSGTIGWISPAGVVRSFNPPLLPEGSAENLALGPDGNMWFVDPRPTGRHLNYSYVGDFTIPFTPTLAGVPVVSGSVTAGGVLAVSPGSWEHEPTTFVYQWQRCDPNGLNCEDIAGEQTSTRLLNDEDTGHTLRAIVTAGNVAGEAQASSTLSPVIEVRPTSPPSLAPHLTIPVSAVGATLTWRFRWTHKFTAIVSLVVHGLATHDIVRASCLGYGCALTRHSVQARPGHCYRRYCAITRPAGPTTEMSVAVLFKDMRLKPGAHVTVSIVSPGLFGKQYTFSIRSGKPPTSTATCLAPGSYTTLYLC